MQVTVIAGLGADMREVILVGTVFAILVNGAHAGAVATLTKPPELSPACDWSGFYVGAHFGYAGGSSEWSSTPGPPSSGTLDFYKSYDMFKGTGSYFAGLQTGYNYLTSSRFLLGAEADISFPNSLGGTSILLSGTTGLASYAEQVEMFGTLRGRIGYAPGNWLFYVTGGFAWSYDQFTRSQIAGVAGAATPGSVDNLFMVPRVGGVAGAGVEVALTSNWAARLEYLYTDYGSRSVSFPASAQRFNSDLIMQSMRAGLDYQLGHNEVEFGCLDERSRCTRIRSVCRSRPNYFYRAIRRPLSLTLSRPAQSRSKSRP